MVPDWVVILSYVLFGLGGVLMLVAFIRICWYCFVARKDKKERKNFYDNPHYFSTHMTDPWLKDNAIVERRLDDGSDRGSLRDINISEFIHNHSGESPKSLSDRLYQSLVDSDIQRTHIDDSTMQSEAHYEEPNTNLIIAMKDKHIPPEHTDVSSYGSDTALVKQNGIKNDVTNGDVIMTSESEEQFAALSALDLATAAEDTDHNKSDVDTSQDESPTTPRTPHPTIATANEPLAVDSEMIYVFASTIFVSDQGTTQL